MSGKVLQAQQFSCPKCGVKIRVLSNDSELVVCQSCSSHIDLETVSVISKALHKPPQSKIFERVIDIGDIGFLRGNAYQVVGRLLYSGSWTEWDSEDSDWWSGPWSFEELVLVSDDKEYLYISEDEESYYLSETFVPELPSMPAKKEYGFKFMKSHSKARYPEFFDGSLQYFEGEFSWKPTLGEGLRSAEYEHWGNVFSAEQRSLKGKPLEIEFFKSKEIKGIELARAFDKHEKIADFERRKRLKIERTAWASMFAIAAMFVFVLGIINGSGSGKAIFSDSIQTPYPEDGATIGPFPLEGKDEIYSIEITARGLNDNAWSWGGVELLNRSQDPINAVEHEFWRESGYDSDGHWSESSLSRRYLFQLETPGAYFLRLFGEQGTGGNPTITATVYRGAQFGHYYYTAAGLAALFMLTLFGYAQLLKSPKNY